MAKDIRNNDTADRSVAVIKAALIQDCKREEENCLYTSTTLFIWLRTLRWIRSFLWVMAAAAAVLAANHILRGDPDYKIFMAGAAVAGALLPGIIRALKIDHSIRECANAAATFKNLQNEFRRAAEVWSHKTMADFESEARKLFKQMNEARKPSLTPPEWCFWLARRKIKAGHYQHDVDAYEPQNQVDNLE